MSSTLDIDFVCDNTGSMEKALEAVPQSAIEISALISLAMGCNSLKLGVVGDYDRKTPDNQKGGCVTIPRNADNDTINYFVDKYMRPYGGGRIPEAYITSLHLMLQSGDVPQVLFWILDALPHGYKGAALDDEGKLEKKFLDQRRLSQDWDVVCDLVKEAGVTVFTFSTVHNQSLCECYTKLGYYIPISSNTTAVITRTVMSVFNALIGQSQDDNGITYHYQESGRMDIRTCRQIEPLCKIDFIRQLSTIDPEFVINTFLNLLDPLNPHSVMCLTTNQILGKYWRTICGKYHIIEDRKYSEQCKAVMDKFSLCQNRLNPVDCYALKKWNEESHNDSPIIHEMIKKVYVEGDDVAIIPQEMLGSLSLDDVLSLGRECEFAGVSKVIAAIQITNTPQLLPESEDEAPRFIPMKLINKQFFSLIGNLLSPGVILPRTASMMIAVLSLNNKFLKKRAKQFLKNNKGKWIDWSLIDEGGAKKQKSPAFWPVNFFRLVNKLPEELLTPEEHLFRDKFLSISRIVCNHDAVVSIKCPLMSDKLRQDVTWKRLCIGCNHKRCFTTFPGNSDFCGICISLRNKSIQTQAKNYGYKTDPKEIAEQVSGTHWTQCFICKGNYGITATNQLKVRAKCHFCRLGQEPECVQCIQCLGHYLSPGGSAFRAMHEQIESLQKLPQFEDQLKQLTNVASGEFLCPRCIDHPDTMTTEVEVKISTLLEENQQLKKCIPYTPYDTLVNSKEKLWMRVLKVASSEAESISRMNFTFNKFAIHDHDSVGEKVVDTLFNHCGIATCDMCVSEVSIANLTKWCGHCQNRACKSCINAVYGQFEVGKVVQQCNVSCPFCKSPPKFEVISNLEIRHMRNLRPTNRNRGVICQWDPQTIYAACGQCLCIKPALARECARASPTLVDWICEDCTQANQIPSILGDAKDAPETKQCPKCDVSIQRTGGCNHITCQCGTHWCWVCGSDNQRGIPFNSHSIYDHMSHCGGIFPGDVDGDDDDYIFEDEGIDEDDDENDD